jgi:hypothetical protein
MHSKKRLLYLLLLPGLLALLAMLLLAGLSCYDAARLPN